jgi:hypothetical protein
MLENLSKANNFASIGLEAKTRDESTRKHASRKKLMMPNM